MEQITIRDVGNKQVYDSYMGILRISPNMLDGEIVDDTTLVISNPKEQNGSSWVDRKIILSDSDGFELGAYFVPKVRTTTVYDGKDQYSIKNVINLTFNSDNEMYVSKSLNVRSTLFVNKENQTDRFYPIQVFSKNDGYYNKDVYDVILYPIDSPNDESYFNARNKLGLIDYESQVPVNEQLEKALHNKSREWYDTEIAAEHKVKIGDKHIFTVNKDLESVPVLYTKDYILGSYNGHTTKVTQSIKDKYIGTASAPDYVVPGESCISKLSFVRLDDIVWKCLDEVLTGQVRDTNAGRYTKLGLGSGEHLCQELFGTIGSTLPEKVSKGINNHEPTAPLLATGVEPGLVMYTAIPFRRFAFHQLRQIMRNAEDEENGMSLLDEISPNYKSYYDNGKITAVNKKDPGFMNSLTKEFVLCDGKILNYTNYPTMNTENSDLFVMDDSAVVIREANGKPKTNIKWRDSLNVYNAIRNSTEIDSTTGEQELKVPHLLDIDNLEMRYIRGLNWIVNDHLMDSVIDIDTDIQPEMYGNCTYKIEMVEGSDWGLTSKDFSRPGNYRTNVDFKIRKSNHKHYVFYQSNTSNQGTAAGSWSAGTIIPGGEWGYYRTSIWNVGEVASALPSDYGALANYSFHKHNKVGTKYRPNSFDGYTPVPCAGLFAWRLDGNGQMADFNEASIANGTYRIQNSGGDDGYGELISTDKEKRKEQLAKINACEGRVPIANQGGAGIKITAKTSIYCKKKKKSGRHNRYRDSWYTQTGAYKLLKSVNGTGDVERCITSIPIADINDEINENTEPDEMIEIGGVETVVKNNISNPPSINLLPLFKI